MMELRSKSFLILFLLIISLVTTVLVSISSNRKTLEQEESQVYLSIFNPNPDIKTFPNVYTVSKPSTCNISTKRSHDIPPLLIKALLQANNQRAKPVKLTALKNIMSLLSWKETRALNEDGILLDFNPQNKTLFYLSRAGFNKNRSEAIVCIENKSDRHNEGFVIQLRKIEGKWKTIKNTYIKFL